MCVNYCDDNGKLHNWTEQVQKKRNSIEHNYFNVTKLHEEKKKWRDTNANYVYCNELMNILEIMECVTMSLLSYWLIRHWIFNNTFRAHSTFPIYFENCIWVRNRFELVKFDWIFWVNIDIFAFQSKLYMYVCVLKAFSHALCSKPFLFLYLPEFLIKTNR